MLTLACEDAKLTQPLLALNVELNCWISQRCYMDLSKLLYVFLALCQTKPSWSLAKSLHGFVRIDLWIGFIKVVSSYSCPLPNKTKLKFDQKFKACLCFCI